jgi:hypothetical protein
MRLPLNLAPDRPHASDHTGGQRATAVQALASESP